MESAIGRARSARQACPIAACLLSAALFATGNARADRSSASIAPVDLYFADRGRSRFIVADLDLSYGATKGVVMPYVGGAVGIAALYARAGLDVVPLGLEESGPMLRVEARPGTFLAPCLEPTLLGGVGAGYRWSIERTLPGERAGASIYLLPAVDAGVGWLREGCTVSGGGARSAAPLLGVTVRTGLDW